MHAWDDDGDWQSNVDREFIMVYTLLDSIREEEEEEYTPVHFYLFKDSSDRR